MKTIAKLAIINIPYEVCIFIHLYRPIANFQMLIDRQVPRKPCLVGGVKGHNKNETSFPGSPGLWPESFNILH
jgi:hypothetical protein